MPDWKMPDLQIDIGGLKNKFTKPTECGVDSFGNTIYCVNWIGEYIAGIYKYAIGIVGILAAVVLMIGGVMWIIAGGSATMIGEAKAWIGASLTGLVIALTSYLILYQINPALTVFQPLGIAQVKKILTKTDFCAWQLFECKGNQTAGDAESCGEKPEENYQYCCCAVRVGKQNVACSSRYRTGDIIMYNPITEAVSPSTVAPNCKKLNLDFDSYGSSANILRALAVTESSCNQQAQSPASACGLMQLMPATAQRYDSQANCEWLKNNPQKSIDIAFKYIRANTAAHSNLPARIFAGYNSGYATSPNPDGTKGGLVPSSDCPGKLAFECCLDPGELAQTQDHVLRSIMYLNWINANSF